MARLLLWHFAISHFTEKARWALDYKQIPHERRMLFMDYPLRSYLRTGQLSLPVLFADGAPIVDSTRILAWLESYQPDPRLFPQDPALHERALDLEDFFDEQLGPHLRALVVSALFERGPRASVEVFGLGQGHAAKRAMRAAFPVFRRMYVRRHRMQPERLALARGKVDAALARLEAEIGRSGYLVGDSFSVADLTAAALFYPIALPPQYPYPLPECYREALAELLAKLHDRPALQWVREMYRRHRGVYAGPG